MKALAFVSLLLVAACGGREYVADCGSQQLCQPEHAMPFCCPNAMACGTGPLDRGGNGCPENACCPSPVADGGAE